MVRSPTYSALLALRGFQVDGSTEHAVNLIRGLQIYPLGADPRPAMVFLNGSRQPITTVFPDTARFFDLLAMLVNEEPATIFSPLERFQMQSIGIVKGHIFAPDDATRARLDEAAQLGGAMARANTFQPLPRYFYPGKQWQGITDLDYTFVVDGVPQVDVRDNVYYMAIGNSYLLHIDADIPVLNFWSVLAYDAVSQFLHRSRRQRGRLHRHRLRVETA